MEKHLAQSYLLPSSQRCEGKVFSDWGINSDILYEQPDLFIERGFSKGEKDEKRNRLYEYRRFL
jgi:hypothetical protein